MNGTQVIVPSDPATQWGVDHGYGMLYFIEQQASTIIGAVIFLFVFAIIVGNFINIRSR